MLVKRNILLIVFIITTIFTINVFSQVNDSYMRTHYSQVKDSLLNLKSSYSKIVNVEKSEVDSLKDLSKSLDKKITDAENDLSQIKHKYFIAKYGKEDGSRVFDGRIWKGMTEQMMRDSWGKPDKTNVNNYAWGKFSQYYYGDVTYFFKNGKLTDWEEKKKDKK